MDCNGVGGWAFVTNRGGGQEKMCGTARVGNDVTWGGRRTGGIGSRMKASGVRFN